MVEGKTRINLFLCVIGNVMLLFCKGYHHYFTSWQMSIRFNDPPSDIISVNYFIAYENFYPFSWLKNWLNFLFSGWNSDNHFPFFDERATFLLHDTFPLSSVDWLSKSSLKYKEAWICMSKLVPLIVQWNWGRTPDIWFP